MSQPRVPASGILRKQLSTLITHPKSQAVVNNVCHTPGCQICSILRKNIKRTRANLLRLSSRADSANSVFPQAGAFLVGGVIGFAAARGHATRSVVRNHPVVCGCGCCCLGVGVVSDKRFSCQGRRRGCRPEPVLQSFGGSCGRSLWAVSVIG